MSQFVMLPTPPRRCPSHDGVCPRAKEKPDRAKSVPSTMAASSCSGTQVTGLFNVKTGNGRASSREEDRDHILCFTRRYDHWEWDCG